MSNTVLNAVFEHSLSKGLDRLVLVAIADRADDSGTAWCGTEDIARRSGIARNHVTRHTKNLVAMGELEVGFRQGKNRTNHYRVVARPTMGHVTGPTMGHVTGPTTGHVPPPTAGQAQGGTVPPRGDVCPTMVQNPSHYGTRTPKNPKRVKRERFDAGSVDLPFSSERFGEAWRAWVQHRKEKRQPLTPTATAQQLARLREIGEMRAIAAILHSVEGGYQGIFEARGSLVEKPRFSVIGEPLK